jgi:SAM-dependent methyltransferase
MPYKKYFMCHYVGSDYNNDYKPDIVALAWKLPVEEGSFDAALLLQSLEHIADTAKTVLELKRILKPGGEVFLTVPQTMKNHSGLHPSGDAPVSNFSSEQEPYWRVDYYRYTKYGLIYLFRDFEIIKIVETTGYIGTLMQLINYFFLSLTRSKLLAPLYILTNSFGLFADYIGNRTQHSRWKIWRRFYHSLYGTLTSNYIVVLRKPH